MTDHNIKSRDPQAAKLYAWEDAFIHKHANSLMSKSEIATLIEVFCRDWTIKTPKIEFIPLQIACHANLLQNSIRICDWGRRPDVVIHELTHLFMYALHGLGHEPHGAEFTGKLINFYAHYMDMNGDYLKKTAVSSGLLVEPFDVVPMSKRAAYNSYSKEDFSDLDF